MSVTALDPIVCAAFLTAACALAGCAQVAWLAAPISRRLAWPLDAGLTVRGRRVFGPNKTIRGFVVMVPATGAAFVAVAAMTPATGRWALPLEVYGALGLLAGLGFMLGELPNSFVKRQLGITAGQPAPGRLTRPLFFVIDHIDSTCGVVAMLLLVVPVPAWTVAYVLAASLIVHTAFSRAAFHLGGKARAA